MLKQPTLLAAAAIVAAIGLAYGYVGSRLSRRPGVEGPAKNALLGFSVWWWATGLNLALGGGLYAAAAYGITDLTAQLTYAYVQRLLLVISLTGLMHYLTFLLTGRSRLVPIAVLYGAYYVLLLTTLVQNKPSGVFVGEWRTDLAYATDSPQWLQLTHFACLVVPPVVGAMMYFRLYFHVDSPTQRYRIAVISASLIVWWVVAVVAGQRATLAHDLFQIVNRVLGLAAALAILIAYEPPSWIQARLDRAHARMEAAVAVQVR